MQSMRDTFFRSLIFTVPCMAFVSCLGLGGDSDSRHASIRLVPMRASTEGAALARRGGGSTAEGLESFQVAISAIQLAKDISVEGTATSNPVDPLVIFENPDLLANHPGKTEFLMDFPTT